MTITKNQINSFASIEFDVAHEEGAQLEGVQKTELDGTTVYAGVHREHGPIHIIVPPLGCGILLFPFAIRDLECDK